MTLPGHLTYCSNYDPLAMILVVLLWMLAIAVLVIFVVNVLRTWRKTKIDEVRAKRYGHTH